MIRTAPRSPAENREMPIHKAGTILYTNATSHCAACGHIVFSVKTPQKCQSSESVSKSPFSLGETGLAGYAAAEHQL